LEGAKIREVFVEILTQLSPAGANSGNQQYPVGMTTEVREFNPSRGGHHPFRYSAQELEQEGNFVHTGVKKSLLQFCYLHLLSAKMASVIMSASDERGRIHLTVTKTYGGVEVHFQAPAPWEVEHREISLCL
jgi:hypothetical protein